MPDDLKNINYNPDLIIKLLQREGQQMEQLLNLANRRRSQVMGPAVHLRGLIEISNFCCRNCCYCGLRRDNRLVNRYRMTAEEIVSTAAQGAALGYKTVVIQGGEDPHYDRETIAGIVDQIKSRHNIAVTLSLGERNREDYRMWRRAGADRYLLKHETADPTLYHQLHPDLLFENRLRCLNWLRELDYQVGSGCMVGLPGQTLETLASDLLLLHELEVEMAGIGPFVSHPNTPLAEAADGTLEMSLKMIAITRLLLPGVHLPATTALRTIAPDGLTRALQSGANVIMVNITPVRYRSQYEIYPGRTGQELIPEESFASFRQTLTSLQRTVARDEGHGASRCNDMMT